MLWLKLLRAECQAQRLKKKREKLNKAIQEFQQQEKQLKDWIAAEEEYLKKEGNNGR